MELCEIEGKKDQALKSFATSWNVLLSLLVLCLVTLTLSIFLRFDSQGNISVIVLYTIKSKTK